MRGLAFTEDNQYESKAKELLNELIEIRDEYSQEGKKW